MIRTKEFLLFLLIITFLLSAIMLTLWLQEQSVENSSNTQLVFAEDLDDERLSPVATVVESGVESDYSVLQAKMREKILAYRQRGIDISENFIVGDPATLMTDDAETATNANDGVSGVRQCSDYQTYQSLWPDAVAMAEREGARLFYQQATDSDRVKQFSPEDVLVQLPVHARPHISPSCLVTDVIGITKNGSLLRNHETDTYKIFPSSTIIGYALDGFPIFGSDESVRVDQCGGATIAGEYGYVLQSGRDTILNCFSGTPTGLPQ